MLLGFCDIEFSNPRQAVALVVAKSGSVSTCLSECRRWTSLIVEERVRDRTGNRGHVLLKIDVRGIVWAALAYTRRPHQGRCHNHHTTTTTERTSLVARWLTHAFVIGSANCGNAVGGHIL